MVFLAKLLPDCDFNQEVYWLLPSSYLHPAHSEDFYPRPVWRTTLWYNFLYVVMRLDNWACLQIWATDIFLVPVSNHAAEAPRVLCCFNTLVSTPADAMMLVIHRAKVCADTDLCGFLSWMNILTASVSCNGAVLTKYSLRDRTGHIEGLSGNDNTFTQPLRVFYLECWKCIRSVHTQSLFFINTKSNFIYFENNFFFVKNFGLLNI